MWTEENWCELVSELEAKLEKYDVLLTKIRNILTDAGIPDQEEYPDEDVDDHEKSLRSGGLVIPLAERVEMLVERYKNVLNLSKMSYVFNPADKNAKLDFTIYKDAERLATTTTKRIRDAMVEARGKRIEAKLKTSRPKVGGAKRIIEEDVECYANDSESIDSVGSALEALEVGICLRSIMKINCDKHGEVEVSNNGYCPVCLNELINRYPGYPGIAEATSMGCAIPPPATAGSLPDPFEEQPN